MLFNPVIDVTHKPYCGPTAVSALTGVPLSRIEKMIRRCRRGGYRTSTGRRIPIKGTYHWELLKVLERLGCKVEQLKHTENTFGKFCEDTAHINSAFLVRVTGHMMATFKSTFCDTSTLSGPIPVAGYHRASRRVRQAWRVTAPAQPLYGTEPTREPKPKRDIKAVRAERVVADIKRWERKRKLAVTKLRRLNAARKRYEKAGILAA